jgi:hypothetical protein
MLHLLESRLGPILSDLEPDTHLLRLETQAVDGHGCEARYLRRTSSNGRCPSPAASSPTRPSRRRSTGGASSRLSCLIDESIARLEEGTDDFARWLQGCREIERAELRSEANEQLIKFFECWPRLLPRWRPAVESRVRYDLFNERVTLQGKVDLQLGQPEGTTAGKVLVDFKTGRFSPMHLEDLRFYALIETLRIGTPPRLVASYYLDQGRFVPEEVTVAQLETTVMRVVAGIQKMVMLTDTARVPLKITGPACRWCPLLGQCTEGTAALAAAYSDDVGPSEFGPNAEPDLLDNW